MKMKENQLEKLVDKAKQGDSAAFEELYSISFRQVYFTCISFLGNEEDAKDVMQDVYITAYEKLSSLNDAEKFVPWVNRIAVNLCKKILMKKSAVFMEIENAADELIEENENFLPEEYITQKEKRKLVLDIMRDTLSDIQYKTVILCYFNGLPVEEIADIMECPPGTVKYRLSVARAKIKDSVDAYENRSGDKLYSVVGLPLLMRLLTEEANSIDVPDMLHDIMEAVKSHLAAEKIVSADAASITNTASTNNTTNISKGGTIKKMLKTPKTIIAATAATVVIIGGIVAAVIATNHENTPSSGSQTRQESQQASFDAETDQNNQQGFSSTEIDQNNSQASSDTNESVFWLHTADWGEEKDLAGITLFNGECTAPINLDDFDGDEHLGPYCITWKNSNGYDFADSYNFTELLTDELIMYSTMHCDIATQRIHEDYQYVTVDHGKEAAIEYIRLENYSGEDMPLRQTYENNWFSIVANSNFLMEFGADMYELTEEEYYTNYAKVQLEAVIDKYGRPSYLIYDRDSFLENYENNSDYIVYTLVWEKEDFVITLEVCEAIFNDTTGYCLQAEHLLYSDIDFDYGMVIDNEGAFRYITKEVWDNYRDVYCNRHFLSGYKIYELDDLK